MQRTFRFGLSIAALGLAALGLAAGDARALINPQLQPFIHLPRRYRVVLGTRVASRNLDDGAMTLEVTDVISGQFQPRRIHVTTVEATRDAPIFIDDGHPIVAYVGRNPTRHEPGGENSIVFYGDNGVWHEAEADPEDPARWTWTRVREEQTTESLFGCYNGAADRFLEMMRDWKAGRAFFPPRAFIQLRQQAVGRFAKPVRGVALYDLDGDGRCDIYACSEAGNRAYVQTGPLEFTDRTDALGLAGLATPSSSLADANADGWVDLLAGGRLFLGGPEGFRPSDRLPPAANEGVKTAAFVQVNGDGWPDVIVSRIGGGLAVYLNPGAAAWAEKAAFTDATKALGLDGEALGADGTGFVAPGDLNGDGRTDLFYGAASGVLLVQGEDGMFTGGGLGLDFSTAGAGPGLTGAACFGPLWRDDRSALVVPTDYSYALLTLEDGGLRELVTATNELHNEPTQDQLAVLAADLNVDGRVDLYTASRSAGVSNAFHANRGYGSYMNSVKAKPAGFPDAHRTGAWGLAAGDVDGDGANELLLGGVDGNLTLLVNETLRERKPKLNPTYHEAKLLGTRVLSVHVTGKVGVLGAVVTLAEAPSAKKGSSIGGAGGRVIARRSVGTQFLTGCRGPDTINLAVREPGRYVLAVRYADGHERTWPVNLSASTSTHVKLRAERQTTDGPLRPVGIEAALDTPHARAALPLGVREREGPGRREPPSASYGARGFSPPRQAHRT